MVSACKVDFESLVFGMGKQPTMDSRVVAELLVHLGRIASAGRSAETLTPAHWTVLRYFARANRFSRTPSAFAEFHGTTRGTASQMIKSLETRGYLTRARSQSDGRSTRIDLTDKARAILPNDPLGALVRAADALSPGVRSHFAKALQSMLCQVAWERGKRLFGTCASCEHLNGDYRYQDGSESFACNCVDEPLDLEELEQLCINFLPTKI